MAAPHAKRPESGRTGLKGRRAMRAPIFPFSSIRTVTVGFGIAPNLLTPPIARRALAGFGDHAPFTAGGDFHPAPRTRSDRNPTDAINAALATPMQRFSRAPRDHPEPTERFSTANDYYPTGCDSCRGGTWVARQEQTPIAGPAAPPRADSDRPSR